MVLGMAGPVRGGPKRSPVQREKDLVETARLILQRKSQAEIAQQLGVSNQQISQDVKLLKKRWREQALLDFHEFLAEELALTYQVEAEAWRGWNRSSKDAMTKTQQAKDGKEGREQSVTVRTVGQAGDPRFLAEILECSKRRLVLMGLLNPGEVGEMGTAGYLDQVREEEEFLKEHGHTADQILAALQGG